MAEDKLITKNDLSEAIQAIEVKYQALGDKTHGRYVHLLLDELKTKGFDVDNLDNIKRLDNFVSTQEFLDITTLDELVMSDDMGRLQGTFLDDISNLDDNLQIIDTPTNVVDDLLETLYEKYDQYLDADVFEEGALNFNIDVDDTGKEYISLQNIAIKDEYQNKGIGKEILNEIKKTSDELSIPIVATALDTEPTGFFAKQGFVLDKDLGEMVYTPTNVVDDFKLSGTMGGNTTPTGVNIAYVNVEDIEQFIQFDRKAEGNLERINNIKETILDKGYLYDTAYEGGVVFGVIVDEAGNVQIPEGNHRLQALIDVAKETGQEIYVPINPMLTSTGGGNKVQLTSSDNAYNSMKQLLTDMLEGNKNFNVERTISEKLGEPGTRIIGLDSYTYPGGAPGTSTTQSNIKKFFNSIGLNTITYDELPDNSIYKTGVNTFTDTPGGSLGAAKLNDPLVFDSWVDNYANTTTSFVDNLPLVKPVKDMFLNAADNRIKKLARQAATPGGILDAVDIWEIGVLTLVAGAIAYNEIDEIPKIGYNAILRTYNLSQGRPIDAPLRIIGLPVLSVSEYDIDFEYAMETLEKGEKVMPTDIIIKKVGDVVKGAAETGAVTGFGYVPPNLTKTDTMETTQKIQPGVQEEKMFKKAPKKRKPTGSAGAKIL